MSRRDRRHEFENQRCVYCGQMAETLLRRADPHLCEGEPLHDMAAELEKISNAASKARVLYYSPSQPAARDSSVLWGALVGAVVGAVVGILIYLMFK